MSHLPRVGLVWRTERLYGSEAIRGVADYAHRHGPWHFLMNQSNDIDIAHLQERSDLDGIILCQDWGGQLSDVIWPKNIPIVSLERRISEITPWQVLPDNQAVGRLVAEEFVKRGFRWFAYCRATDFTSLYDTWDPDRFEGFRSVARKAGAEPLTYQGNPDTLQRYELELDGGLLAGWIKSLPKPVGIMAPSDIRARYLLLAAESVGVRVPEEVAIIGVNNEPWAEITFRGLSSVELDGYRAGYLGAELLRKIMEKQPVKPELIRVAPRRLVTRRSSDALAIDDPEVVTAVRFIAENAKNPIEVRHVVDASFLSRRALERRFKNTVHRSIQQEIRRVRIERAKNLLADEEIALAHIAAMAGFVSTKAFTTMFQRAAGMTARAYRRSILMAKQLPPTT